MLCVTLIQELSILIIELIGLFERYENMCVKW